jgi:hypothetical protein
VILVQRTELLSHWPNQRSGLSPVAVMPLLPTFIDHQLCARRGLGYGRSETLNTSALAAGLKPGFQKPIPQQRPYPEKLVET